MDILFDHIIALLLMAVLLLCSAFFSGTETALFSLTRDQIKRLRAHGHHGGKILSLLADNPSGLLIAILFGNLVMNILFFCISVVIANDFGHCYGQMWGAVVGLGVLLLVILCGEILPKAAGLTFPERIVLLNSPVMRGWFHFMGPVRRVLDDVQLLSPHTEDVLTLEEGRNIKSAFYRLRRNPQHCAVIVDIRQHPVGFVRMEDIARYIIG